MPSFYEISRALRGSDEIAGSNHFFSETRDYGSGHQPNIVHNPKEPKNEASALGLLVCTAACFGPYSFLVLPRILILS